MRNKQIFTPILSIVFFTLVTIGLVAILMNVNKQPSNKTSTSGVIYTTFYPLKFITSNIVGDKFSVENITPAGAEPHDFEPSAKTLADIDNSKGFVYLGEEIDPWAQKKADSLKPKGVLAVAVKDQISLTKIDGGTDPHFWLNPKLVSEFAQKLSNQLSLSYPEHAAFFNKNLMNFQDKLANLDTKSSQALSQCSTRKIFTSHDAFNYFASQYNLETIAITGLSPEEEPSSQKISEIIDQIKKDKAKYIFLESASNPKITEVITSETGAKTLELNPIETVTAEEIDNGKDYFSIFNQNTDNLKVALNCV